MDGLIDREDVLQLLLPTILTIVSSIIVRVKCESKFVFALSTQSVRGAG